MTGSATDLLRTLAPQVLGVLIRRYGDFHDAEDALQEASLAAAVQWPAEGVPENPRGWLLTVAGRRLTDTVRSERARRDREAALDPATDPTLRPEVPGTDDTLRLLRLCCHPSLTAPSQIALTLRAVGGLSTAEIAGAFLVPETTMGQRISRAKQRIAAAGATFAEPSTSDYAAVLHVLYLIFNEGYTATSGPQLHRVELSAEAIRLAREVHRLLPGDGEVAGLLALMLLTDARRPGRVDTDGGLVPLAEQDRSCWDAGLIAEGVELISAALASTAPGPYQLQAAIAALHAEAADAADTDWPQILVFYELLVRTAPSPVVTLNHAVALAMVRGPKAGLALLRELDGDARLAGHHRLHAVRAHLLEQAGDPAGARAAYLAAAQRTTSLPEQRYLHGRATRLQ